MNKAFQYGIIVVSLLLGMLANVYWQGQASESMGLDISDSSYSKTKEANQEDQPYISSHLSTQNELSKLGLEDTMVESPDVSNANSKPQITDWQQQKEAFTEKFTQLNRAYINLNKRYQIAKARLDALTKAPISIDSRLLGTSFELIEKHLSADERLKYESFNDTVDTAASSYELQTMLSDYFILQVNTDITYLHMIECKGNVCALYLYSNDFIESLGILDAIDGITDEYTLALRLFKTYAIEKDAYSNEDYKYVMPVAIAAKKN
jgi:hypothetical protein